MPPTWAAATRAARQVAISSAGGKVTTVPAPEVTVPTTLAGFTLTVPPARRLPSTDEVVSE